MRTANLEEHEFRLAGALEAARPLVRFSEVCNKMPKKAQTFFRTLKKPKPPVNHKRGKNIIAIKNNCTKKKRRLLEHYP